jgi:hypothetical protein
MIGQDLGAGTDQKNSNRVDDDEILQHRKLTPKNYTQFYVTNY